MTMAKPDGSLFVGVDVGTQSVRAAVVNAKYENDLIFARLEYVAGTL